MSALNQPHFQDAESARLYLEAVRWPDGPICPHCGSTEGAYQLTGKSHRHGLHKCKDCREQFTVTVGTVFERSKIALNVWLQAVYLLCSSKKGISAKQLERMLGVTYKTAWFMSHRIREAMTDESYSSPMGGEGKIIEADETYIGGKEKNKHSNKKTREGRGSVGKQPVVSLIERGGNVRSFHMPEVSARTIGPILHYHVNRKSYLVTDESRVYSAVKAQVAVHEAVNHKSGEYVRDKLWHTNTAENYFSILKRGIVGTYHHVSQQHLKRYVGEFDFRYNNRKVNDGERADIALKGIEGKRLTYQESRTQKI